MHYTMVLHRLDTTTHSSAVHTMVCRSDSDCYCTACTELLLLLLLLLWLSSVCWVLLLLLLWLSGACCVQLLGLSFLCCRMRCPCMCVRTCMFACSRGRR